MTTGRINQIAFVATRPSTITRGGREEQRPCRRIPTHPRDVSQTFDTAARRHYNKKSSCVGLACVRCACAPSEKTPKSLAEDAPVCGLQAHGSASGERDRDETSGRETVQHNLHYHATSETSVALRLSRTQRAGRPRNDSETLEKPRRPASCLNHTGPGVTRRALRMTSERAITPHYNP